MITRNTAWAATAAILAAAPATSAPRDPDAAIEAQVRHSYNFRVHLKDDPIQVACKGGVVTLSGSVANAFQRTLAEDTVKGVQGVKAVDNQLTIQGSAMDKASDAWLETKVRTTLLYQRNVDAGGILVAAHGGVVTLSGTAASAAQRALAVDVAQDVEGVREVKNDLKVATSPTQKTLAEKIDDASITAQVKASLLAHRGTHMLTTQVRTDRGVVTVRGQAKDPAERELVMRLISKIRGVRRVDNRMTLEGRPAGRK